MSDLWVGALMGAVVAAALVLVATADWAYLRARRRGRRNLRRATSTRQLDT